MFRIFKVEHGKLEKELNRIEEEGYDLVQILDGQIFATIVARKLPAFVFRYSQNQPQEFPKTPPVIHIAPTEPKVGPQVIPPTCQKPKRKK